MKLSKEQANYLADLHNVWISPDRTMFVVGRSDSVFGWREIPAEWMKEARAYDKKRKGSK